MIEMKVTIDDLNASYDPQTRMLTLEIGTVLLPRQGQIEGSNQMGASVENPRLTVALSPHATWRLGWMFREAEKRGRSFGEEPRLPTGPFQ